MIHIRSKERKSGAEQTPDKSVCTDSAIRNDRVHVDDIVETPHDDYVHAHADGNAVDNHADSVDARVRGPCEDEQSDGYDAATGYHERETLLRNDDVAVGASVWSEDGARVDNYHGSATENADDHS